MLVLIGIETVSITHLNKGQKYMGILLSGLL